MRGRSKNVQFVRVGDRIIGWLWPAGDKWAAGYEDGTQLGVYDTDALASLAVIKHYAPIGSPDGVSPRK